MPFSNPDALAAKRNSIIYQLESCLEKVRKERSVTRGQVAPAVRCLKQSMQKECEALQLGNLEGNLLRLGLPGDVRTKCVGTICDEVALFAPLSVDCAHQSSVSYYNNNITHKTCSWVPGLQLLVSNLLSEEEGLKLKDIPSSVRGSQIALY